MPTVIRNRCVFRSSNIGDRRKLYCNTCKCKTHHELKTTHPRDYTEWEEESPHTQVVYWEKFEYRFWVCLGCDTATLEVAYTSAGMTDPKGKEIWESSYFPKRALRDLPRKWFLQLDKKLATIYSEVIACFNAGLNISCTIGLRSLLEGICADRGITKGSLSKKIDQMDQYLPSNIVKSLHSFRFMGNLAAHELQPSSERELRIAIDVMEDLLNFLYELDYKAQRLPQKPISE